MHRPLALALVLAAALASVSCIGSSHDEGDAEYAEFYRQLAPQMQALELDLAALSNAAKDLKGEALSANLLVYGDTLRASATSVNEFAIPPDAKESATALIVATRDLADVSERESDLARGDEGSLTAEDVAAQGFARASDWYDACHKLQDIALARKIDADLRCVTMFGGG